MNRTPRQRYNIAAFGAAAYIRGLELEPSWVRDDLIRMVSRDIAISGIIVDDVIQRMIESEELVVREDGTITHAGVA